MSEGFDRNALLKQLTEARGVSGNEAEVRKIIRTALEGAVDALETDTLGNLVAIKRASGTREQRPLKVLLAAHMDEAGFMVVSVEKDGYARVRKIGELDDRYLLSKPVQIGKDGVNGIIGSKPVHLTDAHERQQAIKVDQFSIDVGAENEGGAGVKMGDYVTFVQPFTVHEQRVEAKALNDRAGCALLVELLRSAGQEGYPVDLYAAFTVQGLVGARGARAISHHYAPDMAIAFAATLADDTPLPEHASSLVSLGGGPVLSVQDRLMMSDRRLLRYLSQTAEQAGIALQYKQPGVSQTGTEAGGIHLAGEGVPSITLSLPCRYVTTPAGVLDLRDFAATLTLMHSVFGGLNSTVLQVA